MSFLTNTEKFLTDTSAVVYFLPFCITVTAVILPCRSSVTVALAPTPSPTILTGGAVRYPNPGSIMSIVSISPSTMFALNTAGLILTIPTSANSTEVSTVKS